MRQFDSGATRDTDEGKLDYEGFLSPLVLERFAEYMHENRVQADGNLRDSDNWQKGIPMEAYVKSAWRHFFAFWHAWRRGDRATGVRDACALLFNIQGWLHEELKTYELTATQKIAAGLAKGQAEQPPEIPGAKSTFVSWEDAKARRGYSKPIVTETLVNASYTELPGYEPQVVETEWSVTCACGWDGQIDSLIMDGTNHVCLCPDCCQPLLELSIQITPEADEANVYEQIGKAVSLGLAYGMGLPKLMRLVERIYIKETE